MPKKGGSSSRKSVRVEEKAALEAEQAAASSICAGSRSTPRLTKPLRISASFQRKSARSAT